MAISVGATITTASIAVGSGALATALDRVNNAVKQGIIQSWTPSTTADSFIVTVPPNTATIVADHGGAAGYNTFANAYFTAWGHTVT